MSGYCKYYGQPDRIEWWTWVFHPHTSILFFFAINSWHRARWHTIPLRKFSGRRMSIFFLFFFFTLQCLSHGLTWNDVKWGCRRPFSAAAKSCWANTTVTDIVHKDNYTRTQLRLFAIYLFAVLILFGSVRIRSVIINVTTVWIEQLKKITHSFKKVCVHLMNTHIWFRARHGNDSKSQKGCKISQLFEYVTSDDYLVLWLWSFGCSLLWNTISKGWMGPCELVACCTSEW